MDVEKKDQAFSNYDEHEDDGVIVNFLPNFIPEDQKINVEASIQENNLEPVRNAPEPSEKAPEDPVTLNDEATLDPATFEALMGVAKKLHAGAMLVDPKELDRVNAAIQQSGAGVIPGPTQGHQLVKTGAQALAEGGMSLLGSALKVGGNVASSLASVLWDQDKEAKLSSAAGAGVAVLPRISEYRISQAEKAANDYEDARQKLWKSDNLPNLRKEIEECARQTGLSVEDVMDKMKPNGEMSDLHEKFCAAMAESSTAQACKKAMDKALDGWMRQYERGVKELPDSETENSPYVEALHDRLNDSRARMQKSTANTPLFDGEEKSHAEKLRQTIQRIMEKLKEMAQAFVKMVRGGANAEAENAPNP